MNDKFLKVTRFVPHGPWGHKDSPFAQLGQDFHALEADEIILSSSWLWRSAQNPSAKPRYSMGFPDEWNAFLQEPNVENVLADAFLDFWVFRDLNQAELSQLAKVLETFDGFRVVIGAHHTMQWKKLCQHAVLIPFFQSDRAFLSFLPSNHESDPFLRPQEVLWELAELKGSVPLLIQDFPKSEVSFYQTLDKRDHVRSLKQSHRNLMSSLKFLDGAGFSHFILFFEALLGFLLGQHLRRLGQALTYFFEFRPWQGKLIQLWVLIWHRTTKKLWTYAWYRIAWRGLTLFWFQGIQKPAIFLWYQLIWRPADWFWKQACVRGGIFVWHRIFRPSFSFIWFQIIWKAANIIWFQVVVKSALFLWYQIIWKPCDLFWNQVCVRAGLILWHKALWPVINFVWYQLLWRPLDLFWNQVCVCTGIFVWYRIFVPAFNFIRFQLFLRPVLFLWNGVCVRSSIFIWHKALWPALSFIWFEVIWRTADFIWNQICIRGGIFLWYQVMMRAIHVAKMSLIFLWYRLIWKTADQIWNRFLMVGSILFWHKIIWPSLNFIWYRLFFQTWILVRYKSVPFAMTLLLPVRKLWWIFCHEYDKRIRMRSQKHGS